MTTINEPDIERYARQTRNATVFLAWVVGILVALNLAAVILVGVQLSKIAQNQTGTTNTSVNSNCLSQGGSDPNC
jgi:hypothetical protein